MTYTPSWMPKPPAEVVPDPAADYFRLLLQAFGEMSAKFEDALAVAQANHPTPTSVEVDVLPIASEVAKLREVLVRMGSQSPGGDPEVARLLRQLLDHERDEGRWNALMETLRKASQDGARAVVSTGASGNAQNVGVKDSGGARIDPATEQKQDDLIAKDFATEATLADVEALLTILNATVYRRTDPLPEGTNRIGLMVPERPSQGPGRTPVHGFLVSGSGNRTAYTVTAGKTLYMQDITVSAYNSSSGSAGDLRIRDGASIERFPLAIPQAGSGLLSSQVGFSAVNIDLREPKPFTTDVRVTVVAGTVTYAIQFSGYEEPT